MPFTEQIFLGDALRSVHPDDLERVTQAITQATNPQGDGSYMIEYRILHKGGRVGWVSVRGKAYFADSPEGKTTVRFSGTVLDVTDRILSEEALRGSERQFRMMADVMPQIVWTAKPDGAIDYTNERWRQFTGSETPGSWKDYLSDLDRDRAIEMWNKSLKTGEIFQTEFRLLRNRDLSYRWFLVRAHPAYADGGKIERWFGTCTDIEDQKAAIAARSEFMSIASHELKTPLTSLKLQTQSMRRNFDKGRTEAFSLERVGSLVNNNEKQIGRLIRLVDDMLDFAKIEAGKLSMNAEKTDICELVREVYERLKEQLEAAGCDSQMECAGVSFAEVDRFRIEQVVTNLLTNAIRYGNRQPVHIRVERRTEKILISVTDQGRGIASEHQETIFKRFERVTSVEEISGLGLGLYISRQIVESHHGKIWVASEIGKGSTFFVELPAEKESA